MISNIRKLTAVSALAFLGTGGAQASIISVTAAGGSEGLLNVVSNADSSSISLDLGAQISGISTADHFDLPQGVLDFINGAGGLSGVHFSVVAGGATNGTSAATYLHSSDNAALTNLANGVRGTWFSNFNNLVANRLNASDPLDTNTAVNAAYGPFASGVSGNYLSNGSEDWGTAGAICGSASDNTCNLVAGTDQAKLFLINFGTSPTGFAGISDLVAGVGGVFATLDLANARLNLTPGTAVPLPAGIWLAGTAFGLAGICARRRKTA